MENKRDTSKSVESEIIIYQTDDGHTKIDVKFQDETVWLHNSKWQIYSNIKNQYCRTHKTYLCGRELNEASTCRKFRQVRTEGNRKVARELPTIILI